MATTIRGNKKLCRGPLHKPGGEYVDLDRFYYFGSGKYKGKPFHRCKPCTLLRKNNNQPGKIVGALPVTPELLNIFYELEWRVGRKEACRRINASNNYLRYLLDERKYKRIKLKTLVAAKVALEEARAKNEVRHKDSISHGAYLRNRVEKIPVKTSDFYKGGSDRENELKREGKRKVA